MDLSGRFNFWRVLLYSRAITPPRVLGGPWQQIMRWWAVFALACGGFGIIYQLVLHEAAMPDAAVSNQLFKPAAAKPATPKAPW
jgi:hypothetical protein